MNIKKIIEVFDTSIRAIQSMEEIYKILQESKKDVYLEDQATIYLNKIEGVITKWKTAT